MSINLTTFRRLTNGFARGCHFNLGIWDFKGIGSSSLTNHAAGVALSPLMSIFCSSTNLPQKSITSHSIRVQSGIPPVNIAKDVSYAPWSVTFYSDELCLLRTLFIKWQEKINNSDNKTYNFPSQYKSTFAFAALLTPQDIPVQVYQFHGLYPSNIQGIQLSQNDSSVLTFSVEFTYDYFQINTLNAFLASFAHEYVFDTILNETFSGTNNLKQPRRISAPFGINIKIPF